MISLLAAALLALPGSDAHEMTDSTGMIHHGCVTIDGRALCQDGSVLAVHACDTDTECARLNGPGYGN